MRINCNSSSSASTSTPICFDRCGNLCCCKFGEMFADQFRRQSIAFAEHFELDQQTLFDVARATADRIEDA